MYISATSELEKKFKHKTHYRLLKDIVTPEGTYLKDTIVSVEEISFAINKMEDGSETVRITAKIRNFIPPAQEEKFFGSGIDPYGPPSKPEMSEEEFSETFSSIPELDKEVKKYNRVLDKAVEADKNKTHTMIFMTIIGFVGLIFFAVLYAIFFSDSSVTEVPIRFTHTIIASFIVYSAAFFVLSLIRRSQFEKYKDQYDECVKRLEEYADPGLTELPEKLPEKKDHTKKKEENAS